MTLLITIIAAVCATTVWYLCKQRDKYRLGTLSLIYWGASIMWFMDFIAEYKELGSEYFNQDFSSILNDSILGISAVAIGLIAWLVILLIKDPNNILKNKFQINKK